MGKTRLDREYKPADGTLGGRYSYFSELARSSPIKASYWYVCVYAKHERLCTHVHLHLYKRLHLHLTMVHIAERQRTDLYNKW